MIHTGFYSQIKEQVTTRGVAVHYGFHVNRQGMMQCPFHQDKTPSMKVDRNFICFGCQERGDVIQFAAKLFGLPEYDAALKLVRDMGLETGRNTPTTRQDTQKGTEQFAERKEVSEEEINRVWRIYASYLRLLDKWKEEYAPKDKKEEFHPLFEEAAKKRDYVDYLLDLLLYGSERERLFVIESKREEVNELERRLKEYGADI